MLSNQNLRFANSHAILGNFPRYNFTTDNLSAVLNDEFAVASNVTSSIKCKILNLRRDTNSLAHILQDLLPLRNTIPTIQFYSLRWTNIWQEGVVKLLVFR